MELTEAQFAEIENCLPRQRGNVSHQNLQVLNAILFVLEQDCKWRAVPRGLGNRHTLCTRMNRWSRACVLERIFAQLQREQILRIKIEAVSLDSTIIKVHPDGTGALKKRHASHRPLPRGMEHQDSSGGRACPVRADFFHSRPAKEGDGPCVRALLRSWGATGRQCALLMDGAYEGDETRQLALNLGLLPVVPPNSPSAAPLEIGSRSLRQTQRGRAPFSPAQRLSPHLHPLRQAGRDVHGLHSFRPHYRSNALVLTNQGTAE